MGQGIAYLIFYSHPKIILRHLKRVKSIKEFKRLVSAILTLAKMALERMSVSLTLRLN